MIAAAEERVAAPVHPDGELARAHLAGRPDAFAELYERFSGRLVLLCMNHVGDTASAEDLAHDVLVRALEVLDGFAIDCPMWPWLKRIANNMAIDYVRKHSRSQASGLLDETFTFGADELPLDSSVTADFADQLAERWLVADVLAAIPMRQAAALELCYLDGWSQSDAADLLGTSSNAFKQLLFRARKTMAEEYERRGHATLTDAVATAGSTTDGGGFTLECG